MSKLQRYEENYRKLAKQYLEAIQVGNVQFAQWIHPELQQAKRSYWRELSRLSKTQGSDSILVCGNTDQAGVVYVAKTSKLEYYLNH